MPTTHPLPRQLTLLDPQGPPPFDDFEPAPLEVGPGFTPGPGFAEDLGVFGNYTKELPVACHLVTEEPLLAGGPSGSGKTRLLTLCYKALQLRVFAPNMAFANVIEDLCGIPDMRAFEQGRVAWLEAENTPWGKDAVLLNEITRTAPALGCKVLDLVDERSLMATSIPSLQYVAATCNLQDHGVEPMSVALLSRFGVLMNSTPIHEMAPEDQARVIEAMGENGARLAFGAVQDENGRQRGLARLHSIIQQGREQLPKTLERHGPSLTRYVLRLSELLPQGLGCPPMDGRRLGKLRRNLATTLALHEAAVRWRPDPYDALYDALCFSVPQVITEPGFDIGTLAAPHAGAWQASFGLGRRPHSPRVRPFDPFSSSGNWLQYVDQLGDLCEEEHGRVLGVLFGRANGQDPEERIRAITEGLEVVCRMICRTDLPPVIVARALGWADRVLGIGSGSVHGAFGALADSIADLGETIPPQDALALRLALEVSRKHHPGGRSAPDADRASMAFREAREAASRLMTPPAVEDGGAVCR